MDLFRKYPLLSRLGVFLVLPFVFLILFLIFFLKLSLPIQNGNIAIQGIKGDVQIVRDENGVVSVQADNDEDVYFAMGFVHAQDRLWQLELQRRIAYGRLSEVFGRASVKTDIWMRTLGLKESAHNSWLELSPAAQTSLEAYANGVNAVLENISQLPPEFILLNTKPEPWTVYDSLAWSKVFSLSLSGNLWREINYLTAESVLTPDKLSNLFSFHSPVDYVSQHEPQEPNWSAIVGLLEIKDTLEHSFAIGGQFVGSNAWVVSGKHTSDGSAVLANDPHLGLQIPSLWYPVKQRGKLLRSSGMSLVGLPTIIFGQNQKIAWGGTNLLADTQDLYLERINPDNPNEYFDSGRWTPFTIKQEEIHVSEDFPEFLNKPLKPLKLEIRSTHRGPLISDTFSGMPQPFSLQWTVLNDTDASYETFYRVNYSQNWHEFLAATENYVAPALNLMYADVEGNIGHIAVGKIPVREGNGRKPRLGWKHKYAWKGYIPKSEMPTFYNPEEGFLISANNKVVDSNYPYFISADWAPDYRAIRIGQLLRQGIENDGLLNIQEHMSIQSDVLDLSAREFLHLIKSLKLESSKHEHIFKLLQHWDGSTSGSELGATIFTVWMQKLKEELFLDELSLDWNNRIKQPLVDDIISSITNDFVISLLNDDKVSWCDNQNTMQPESCRTTMLIALDLALEELRRLFGEDPEDWRWQDAHITVYAHKPFSELYVLDKIFERSIKNGGSPYTINVSNAKFEQSQGYEQTFGAGFRQIIKLSNSQPEHWYMNSTGQSGHVMSSHFDDMIELFQKVEFINFEQYQGQSTLLLTPVDR